MQKRDGNVPHNRGCGELMATAVVVVGLVVVAVLALCA